MKKIIDQKPKSKFRLVLFTDYTHIKPASRYIIEVRNNFLFWEWWESTTFIRGIRTVFYINNESEKKYRASEEDCREDAFHSLGLLRGEITRYATRVIDQRD